MTLSDYYRKHKADLDWFVAWYTDENRKFPSTYPNELIESEWEEQFQIFQAERAGKE